ncbi:AAA family ATPase [Sediminibacillus dalangtanensis]|uniref:AAA family ATPase n=1 Tax=Sediminibacillus dalangtanensis TaxID=2729421 RepID=A0ABX7VSN1_9BACI|nr:AAA family ATPase [Sediminibacillus dalangtanensis]QTM98610.1 AAA family ATPase [Sediminibacillus dalangtanensis]
MKLLAAHIYGFGKWQDFRVKFPEENLFLISGPNESGKSTIRQFLLFILFGLPPKQREFFRPKTGGKIGGRLKLWTEEAGMFYIERTHEKQSGEAVCYLPDGSVKGSDWWSKQLKGMNRESFESVFSFDADDLMKLHAMKADELGELLLGVGMTGTDKIYSIEKQLENELDKRFKPHGKNPEINSQLNKLASMQQEWIQLQEQEESYQQQKKAETELVSYLEMIQRDLEDAKAVRTKQEKLVQALPILYMLAEEEGKWTQLPETDHFPENGLERYEYLQEQLLPLRSRLAVLESNEREYRQEIWTLHQQLWPKEKLERAEALGADYETYQQQASQLDYLKQMRKKAVTELKQQVNDLHLDFNWEQLGSLSMPFHLEDSWHQIKEAEQQVEAEWESIEREERSTEEQLRSLREEQRRLDTGILEESKAVELQQMIDEKRTQKYVESSNRNPVFPDQFDQWRKRQAWTLLGATAIGAVLLGTAAFLSDIKSFYAIGLILFLVGMVPVWRTRRLPDPASEREPVTLRWTETDYKEAEEKLRRHYQILDEQHSINGQIKQRSLQLLKLSERKKFIQEKQLQVERQIREQKSQYPFLTDVAPAYWPKLYHKLNACMEKYHSLIRLDQEQDELIQQMEDYRKTLTVFFKEDGLDEADKTSDFVHLLLEQLETQRQIRQTLSQYEEWLERTIRERERLLEEMQPYEQDTVLLFKTAGVQNEEEFRRLGRQQQEAHSIRGKMDSCRSQLAPLLSRNEISHYLDNLPSQAEAEQGLEQIENKLEELESRMDASRQQLADIRSKISGMERSEHFSQFKHQYSGEIEQLKKQVKQWAVYQTAKEILAETKRSYQQDYLPHTLKAAAAHFHKLTDGKYADIFPPKEGRPFSVSDQEGFRYAVEELSKGTADQLYVSLRLALSSVYQAEKMPFFIDDAFVHFDQKREEEFGSILKNIADQQQQIILFSSSKSIQKSLEEVPVIDLENREVMELA